MKSDRSFKLKSPPAKKQKLFDSPSLDRFFRQFIPSIDKAMKATSELKKRGVTTSDVRVEAAKVRSEPLKHLFTKTTIVYTYEKKVKPKQTKNARVKLKDIINQQPAKSKSAKPKQSKSSPAKEPEPFKRKATAKPTYRTVTETRTAVYCNDIDALFRFYGKEHVPENYRTFIDSSVESLIIALLKNHTDPNEEKEPPIILLYSPHCKENRTSIQKCLELIRYWNYEWLVIADLKIVTIILGLTAGYSKYPCHLCEFDSRADELVKFKNKFSPRKQFKINEKNVKYKPMIDPSKVIIPPLHVKLGLYKQFIKSLSAKPKGYLVELFPRLSEEKLEEGVLTGPDCRKLSKSKEFRKRLNKRELDAFESLVAYVDGFLGNKRSENYRTLAKNLKAHFYRQDVRISVKVHYAVDHLDDFAENCGAYSDEQGEKVHQDIKSIQQRYKGKDLVSFVADYSWSIKGAGESFGRKTGNIFM